MKRHFPIWQIAIFILIIVSLACNMSMPTTPTFLATPSATPVPLPPTIVETIPAVGSEIPLQGLLTVYFSEKMERASVETALSGDFPGGFVFSWVDDATLTLAPKTALPASKKVTFSLAASAKAASGLAMLEAINLSYQTPGPLRVAQVLPAAMAADVSPDSAVVVAFNQPVVALGADQASLPAGLSLEPAAPGKGEWLNTSTYIFHAEPALAGGIQYVARVNPQLKGTNGMPLDANSQNTTWAFSTTLPEVSKITPDDVDGPLALDAGIEIAFNQPMDRASVESGLSLNGPGGKVSGSYEWNKKSSVVRFKPAALLERGTNYSLRISAQARSAGGATLGNEIEKNYQSIPFFGVAYTNFDNGGIRPNNSNPVITFTAPIAEYSVSEMRELVSISPQPTYYDFYVDGGMLYVNGNFSPGKSYTVVFRPEFKDRWGMALGKEYVFNFIEPDARPSLSLGTYLPAIFTRPEETLISVQAVNINTLDITRGSMATEDFLRTQADYNYRESYFPGDAQSWTIEPGLGRNVNEPVDISLSETPLAPGFYQIQIYSPQVENPGNTRYALVVSNLNVTLKTSPSEALVWAMDLRTQSPAQNVTVNLYSDTGTFIASGMTDERGLWRSELAQNSNTGGLYAILSQPGEEQFGAAASDWGQGVAPWDFGLMTDSSGPRPEVYLYSERPVYRPGDAVHYRGILKSWYDGRYTEAGLNSVSLAWFGPTGKLTEQQASISGYGTFNGEFKLSTNAAPGDYSVTVSSDGKDLYNGGLYFKVADYRKPEINLSVTLSPNPAKNGQTLTGNVKAEYFFGSPVADLPFSWRAYSSTSYFSIPEYNTGIQNMRWRESDGPLGSYFGSGEARTGADGSFNISLDNIKLEDTSEITLEITASESGGFPVSARASATVHPENFYIGIRPEAWVGQAGTALGFDLLSVDWDRKPTQQNMNAAFSKVRWERGEAGPYGGYVFTPIYTPVESKSIQSDANGQAKVSFTPPEAGTYVLDMTAGQAHTQTMVWVSGAEDAEWPNLPYQQLQITANKEKYKPGESAEVFIPNPFNAPAFALLTTERSTFKSVEVLSIPAAGYRLKLALTDESAPNIYVSATLLGPSGVDFRQGYVNLPVEPSAFTLNVDLKTTPEKAKPGDNLTLDLTVTDSKGQPVQGEFSMAVVDLAALALADPNSIDILPAYYDIQPLGVRTGLTAAIYTRRILNFEGGRGGGGGADILTLRDKFPDTAYWKADILTDAQGKARVSLILPDNLTTWQVETRGLSKDTKVGQARVRVVTSKELLIRPQTPRFLVVGDHAELAAIVNNTTGQALEATVSLQASGLTLDDPARAEQKVSIAANGRVRVTWNGLVQDGESVDAIFSVKAGSLQDAAKPNDGAIPVLRYSAPETFSTAGTLTGAATRQEIIALPRSFQALGGNLQVELSPSLAAAILNTLKAIEIPEQRWSIEQSVSTFLPNVVTYRTLKESGIDAPELTERLQTSLADDLRWLFANQHADGGWPWAVSSAHSDPYLTAYVLFGLLQATESGLNLDGIDLAGSMQRGRDYLFANAEPFSGAANLSLGWQANRAAFYCYILQKTGGLNNSTEVTDRLYENRALLDPWAKSMLALTLYSISPVDERAKSLLSDVESSAIRTASGAHWESAEGDQMNPRSALFTTAIVVSALAERNPASPLAADAARYLAGQRDAHGRWSSSYETSWVLLALNKYMQASGELRGDFSFSATLNGAPLAQGQAAGPENMTTVSATSALTQLNLGGANSLLINKQDGTGKLYYRAALSVDRPVETAPAITRGISVSREFMNCSGESCQTVTSYQMKTDESGRIRVKLTISLPNESYYLMVQDYIPAGAEILDSSLKTSQQGEQDQNVKAEFDPADPFGEGWGWWYFNRPQIYTDHILWSADYLPAGTYELTYTIVPSLAGEYRVLPAHAWQAYFPEVQGTTGGAIFEIKAP